MKNWNLKLLYKDIDDPQIDKDIKKDQDRVKKFVKKWRGNKEYTKDPNVLKEALDEYNLVSEKLFKPYFYFFLKKDLDQTNSTLKEKYNKINDIYTKLGNEILFFNLNIAKIPKTKHSLFIKFPLLSDYKHFLEQSFASAKYTLTEKEEKVFNITAKTSSGNWADMLSELLNKQSVKVSKEKTVPYSEISRYLNSINKKERDFAAKEFSKVNSKYLEIAEFEINSILEDSKNRDEYRNVKRPDELRLLSDDIDFEIVDTLLETVSKHYDIPQRYYALKSKMLGQKSLGYHERNVPIGKQEKDFSYKESMEVVQRVFNNLDPQFGNIVKEFEKNGSYDVYPKEGKSDGAYCISITKNLPIYILLNHTGKIRDVTTIAHESGHGIHSYLSKKNQLEINSEYPTSLAEVASTFFEDFVLEDILNSQEDKEFVTSVRMHKLSDDISAIFRQVAAYKFEQELHKDFRDKGFLSKEYICDLFSKNMSAYLGDSVDMDESMRLGWVYWSHFRRSFYVYSYASGLLISKGLQSLVREDPKNIKKVKEFLSSGSSLSPKDVFDKMGIDITSKTFWERGISEIEKELELLEKI